jgi:orotate phosphoribosyltransferase
VAQSILETFEKTGALLNGHFVLSSGLRSRQYFQCALVLQQTELATEICADLASRLADVECDAVISPAMGGIIVGQEVGRNLGKRHIFAEKEDGKLIGIVKGLGGKIVAVGCLVDRSGNRSPDFGCKFVSLAKLNVETFEPDKLPPDLAAIPVNRPGSK